MTQNINLGSFSISQGFSVFGATSNDLSGSAVSGIGDINGDGYGDFIIGAYDAGTSERGVSYVIFGKASNFTNIDLASDLTVSGIGFSISGESNFDNSGDAVSAAGDINGDGYDDFIIGAFNADDNSREGSGTTYVVFGKSGSFSNIDLSITDLQTTGQGFSIYGVSSYDYSGEAVGSAGDFNGDGYDDIIIGAYNAGPGEVYVIFGKTGGFTNINLSSDLVSTNQGFKITGIYAGNTNTDTSGDYFGTSVSGAGDINGDGYDDIVIGASNADLSGKTDAGTVYVIFGKASGFTNIDLATTDLTATNQGFYIFGAADNDELGRTAAPGGWGDVNGDGYADFVVSSLAAERRGQNDCGISYVIFGKASGFSNIDLATFDNTQGFSITGAVAGDYSGVSTSGTDVNNDGFDDIIIGAYGVDENSKGEVGRTYVIFGKAGGFLNINLADFDETIGISITGDTSTNSDQSGYSVSGIDINGDGYGDIIIGAPQAEDNSNRVSAGITYVIFGVPNEPTSMPTIMPSISPTLTIAPTSPTAAPTYNTISNINLGSLTISQGFSIFGSVSNDLSGSAVSGIGDINGDGYNDFIIGAYGANNEAGVSYVVFGSSSFTTNIDLSSLIPSQGFYIFGTFSWDNSGYSVSGAADINGDGYSDIIIGAQGTERSADYGTTYVIFGKASGYSDIDLVNLLPEQGFSIYGASVSDYSGEAIGSAGDFNGDGYDDIIIGAYNAGPGEVYVIFGKTGSFTNINLSSDLVSTNQGFKITGVYAGNTNTDTLGDYFGTSVSGAGDINDDGYDDIVIGASNADSSGKTDAGTVYVIFGKASGFTNIDLATTDLTATNQGFYIFGEVAGDRLGNAVSKAGDINNDGFDDIIIGASSADRNSKNNIGISYVVFGKESSFSNIDLAVLNNTQGFSITGSAAGDYSGSSVSGIDINNDGYDDAIVGAYMASRNGFSYNGVTYIIFGKTSEFSNINLGSLDETTGFSITGIDNYDYSGISVSGADDINDDGYNDIIIGAYGVSSNAGTTYVIFGGPEETPSPTSAPTTNPTLSPTVIPTIAPSCKPTISPTFSPSFIPSVVPSISPTSLPTLTPTDKPSVQPTGQPTSQPTGQPSVKPTGQPTNQPSNQPTGYPTSDPSGEPTLQPSIEIITDSSESNQSNFMDTTKIAIMSSIIGGVVILSTVYCIYAKMQHIWPFISDDVKNVGDDFRGTNIEFGQTTYAGEAGLQHNIE